MILHHIEVSDFTRFSAPFRVSIEPHRVNLLCGPNGSGKSSLLAALTLAFTASHKSLGADVKAIQPWGRAVAPRAAVEFSHDSARYRLTKTYLLKGKSALLERWNGTAFEAVGQDETAERELPRFLGGTPGAGENARTRQAWLASILWSRQNETALPPVEGEVRQMIQALFGAQADTGITALVAREAQRAYDLDWTATGRPKKTSEAARLQAESVAARAEAARCHAVLEDIDLLRKSVQDLEDGQSTLRTQAEGLEALFGELDDLWRVRREKLAARTELGLQIDARQQEADRLRVQAERLAGARGRAEESRRNLAELSPRILSTRTARDQADAARREAAARTAAESGRLQAQLDALNAPAAGELAALEALDQDLLLLRARLAGALLHLDLTPQTAARITVVTAETPGALDLAPGVTRRISGSPEIVIEIPGFGTLRASGPAESAAEIRTRLAETLEQWNTRSAPYAGAPVAELRRRRREAAGLESRLADLRSWLEQDAAGRTPEALAAREAAAGLEALEKERRQVESSLQSSLADLSQLERECLPEADSLARRAALALEVLGLREKLTGIDAALAADPPELEQQHARTRADLDGALLRQGQVKDLLVSGRAVLAEKLAHAPYLSFTAARARLTEKEDAWRQAQLSADAAKLLHETLAAVCGEAEAQIIPPLEAGANTILQGISGALPGAVRLDGHLVPHALAAAGRGEDIALDQLSGGEFEQVHFAARLALADLFCLHASQPVVFDDALLATDDVRLGRILEMLESRRERMQILILTCHPERYAALTGAHAIHVPALQGAGA